MSNPNDPAFPNVSTYISGANTWSSFPGLTKREAFAMAAMQGLMSNPSVIGPNPTCGWSYVNCTPEQLSLCAIDQADALLRELAKSPNA